MLCVAAAAACGLSASAQSNLFQSAEAITHGAPQAQTRTLSAKGFTGSLASKELKVVDKVELKAPKSTAKRALLGARRNTRTRGGAIDGYYVSTYNTLISSSYDGGSSVQIVPDAAGDSITIKDFWNGNPVRAHYNATSGVVSIPRQKLLTDANIGRIDLALVKTDGTPDYAGQLTGKLSTDGSQIDFSSVWWAAFAQEGTYKNKIVAAYTNLTMTMPNGTMQYTRDDVNRSYGVLIEQPSPNLLKVTNFWNRGLTIEVNLNRDRTTAIESQTAFINANGAYQLIKCLTFNEAGNLTQYSPILTTEAAAAGNNNTLEWTDWSLLCAEARSYAGNHQKGKLTAFTPWQYPELSVSEFEGDGTEANPYLIKSRDHLILLSDKVNQDTEYTGKYYSYNCTRSFLGKHFALTNDIDMEGYRFDPIGCNVMQHFAGSLDGRGHTIKNLSVKAGSKFYGGLFGICDTLTVIKNINIENAQIESDYNYSAALAACMLGGAIENVKIINPYVVSQRIGGGGVTAVSYGSLTNCHVVDGTIVAAGYVGGVTGECQGGMDNCSAVGTKVYLIGTSGPGAGVVGNLFRKPGKNLAFSGLMSYSDTGDGQDIGGVAGWVQSTTLSESYSTGVVRGYSSDSRVGGVVGVLRGAIENCYSSGLVHCYSRMTSGIVGQMYTRPDFATTGLEPSVKNCYTSAVVESETYMYDRTNNQEVIGKNPTNVVINPVIENVYFDKNITNFFSQKYGVHTDELTKASGIEGFSADVWEFTEGAYPRIKAIANTEAAKYSASAINFAAGDNVKKVAHDTKVTALGNTRFFMAKKTDLSEQGYYSRIADGKIAIGEEFGRDTLYAVNGSVQTYRILNIAPIPFEGAGTPEEPLLIKDKEDLITLSNATTLKGQIFQGLNFKMTSDIDLELDPRFLGISTKAADTYCRFEGTFDGGGHTIHRMLIADRVAWTTAPAPGKKGTLNTSKCYGWSGFIGRLGADGVLRNLNIAADSKLEMYATCAALVGANYGLIDNCRNYADVLGYSCWVGGIAGKSEIGGIIRNCYNAGNITTCYSSVGGIVGSSSGPVENCVNTGDIFAHSLITNYSNQLQMAGGISGGSTSGTVMRNCQNFGVVRAIIQKAGGLMGSNSSILSSDMVDRDTVESCLNLGNAITKDIATSGAIVGSLVSKNYKNVYFDFQTSALKSAGNKDVDGITPASTALLTSGNPVEGLSAEYWDFKAGQYPVVKLFANEPRVAAARKVVALAKEGASFRDLHSEVVLNDAATWSLKNNNPAFRIEGGKLFAPESVTKVETDTLVAVNPTGMVHLFTLKSLPVNPLQGKGTAASPWLITTPAEWSALASYMDATGNTLNGEYAKVTADLDFTGITAINRYGATTATPFSGVMDGDNHTLKGLKYASTANTAGALFGTVTADAVVKNLTLEGSMSGSFSFPASLVDKLYGTVENVVSKVDITSTKTNVGGVVGNAYDGAVLRNVTYSGKITSSTTSIGGVVNTSATSASVTFDKVVFAGTIETTVSHTSNAAVTIGGLVASAGPAVFTDCHSRGEIIVKTPAFSNQVGGFISLASDTYGGSYEFTNCSNETAITAAALVAGFVAKGSATSSSKAYPKYIFTDCVNKGDISAVSTKSVTSAPTAGILCTYTPGSRFIRCGNEGTILSNMNVYCAGIAGTYATTPSEALGTVEFTDCYNSGNIYAFGNQGGGICGYVTSAMTLTNCYNTADIEGNQMVGGICSGFSGTGPKMINCYNTGNITANQQRAAGLIAWGGPVNGLVEGCWNSGNIASASTEQSTKVTAANEVGGLAGASDATFRNCYNVGTVKGLSRVGGLVGNPTKGKTAFYNCYNAGKIEAPKDSCGSIVGVAMIDNGTRWNDANVIENTYYLNENDCANDAPLQAKSAISRRELAALDLGEGFVSPDNFTHPLIKAFAEHETALFHAAELILHPEDASDAVSRNFNVGGSSKVVWTSDCAALKFDGNQAYFTAPFSGAIKVTATAGDKKKEYTLTAKVTSAVDDIDATEVISTRYFTVDGIETAEPQGKVYIVVRKLSDGTERIQKVTAK